MEAYRAARTGPGRHVRRQGKAAEPCRITLAAGSSLRFTAAPLPCVRGWARDS